MSFFLAFTIVHFVGAFVVLGLALFAEYTKLNEVESYFTHNERVRANKRFWRKNHWIDRQYRMLLMFDLLSDSARYVKAGVVTEAELVSVPLALKRWVLWPYYLGLIWVIGTVAWSVWRRWCGVEMALN